MKLFIFLFTITFLFIGCSVPMNKPLNIELEGSSFHSKEILKHNKIYYDKNTHTLVDVLYGTDRKKNLKTNSYSSGRGELKYGVVQVSIPKTHIKGEMERPGYFSNEILGKHIMIYDIEDLNKNNFVSILNSKLEVVKEKDILIFIHGFNVDFNEAVRRTGQLSYDLKFKGVPISYSWPSAGEIEEYMKDEVSVQYTTPHLVEFLSNIIDNKEKGSNIHILGHSMGTRALSNALKEISYKYYGKKIFKNIMLAAPDIDKDVFKVNLLPYIIKTTEKITLYASSDDSALKISEGLHSGERVGQGGKEIFVFNGLSSIDATGIDTSLLGHSYFAEKDLLIGDIKDIIYKSLPPSKRKSLNKKIKNKINYWKFKY